MFHILGLIGSSTKQEEKDSVLDREPTSNLSSLLKFMAARDSVLSDWFSSRCTWTSPECQNELITLMANAVTRQLCTSIRQTAAYTILIDESSDNSNSEQMVFCLRYDLFVTQFYLGLF